MRWPRSKHLIATLLKISCVAGLGVLLWWILSSRRQEEILVRRVSCSPLPWYYFFYDRAPLYTRDELYLPAAIEDNGISIVQMCSNARKWQLFDQLVDNHLDYARMHGHEYDLAIDGVHGVWDKIFYLRDKVRDQLVKPASQRLEWLWYTDVDTFIVNPKIRLQDMLPPGGHREPFLLITKDHNSLNAGTFFLRVDQSSVDFLQAVLQFVNGQRHMRWAEQSAIELVAQRDKLEETGSLVFLPTHWINFYAVEGTLDASKPIFQIHWPSVGFKRRVMLPMLQAAKGSSPLQSDHSTSRQSDLLIAEAAAFWGGID